MSVVRSGIITVTTHGTAVQGPATAKKAIIAIKALIANAGLVGFGNDGTDDVDNTSWYEMSAGDQVVIDVENLANIYFDSASDGDQFCWLILQYTDQHA